MPHQHRRTSSMEWGQLVTDGIADLYLIHPETGKLSPWEDGMDISQSRLVGRGQQGKVYAVVAAYKEDGVNKKRLCAVKDLNGSVHAKNAHAVITDSHETSTDNNIIKHMAVVEKENEDGETQQFALLPFCGLFLEDLIRELPALEKSNSALYEVIVLHALIDLLQALKSIHATGHVHGDVKGANTAYYLGHLCLIDLDCAIKIGEKVSTTTGSPLYMHPACFSDAQFCARPENDIYSLGVVLKQLLLDGATTKRMEEWEHRSLFDISKESSKMWGDALTKRESTPPAPNLKEKLNEFQSMRSKLNYIAEQMTAILPDHQTTVEALLDCCEMLKSELLTRHAEFGEVHEQANQLRDFYESLIPKEFLATLDEDVMSPIRCVSKISFFSDSGLSSPRTSVLSIDSDSPDLSSEKNGLPRNQP